MSGDDGLVGIGLAFITVAVVMFLAVSGTLDPSLLRIDVARLQTDAVTARDWVENALGPLIARLPR